MKPTEVAKIVHDIALAALKLADRKDTYVGEDKLEQALQSQEGVFMRRATYVEGASKERYEQDWKVPAIHGADGRFRKADHKP